MDFLDKLYKTDVIATITAIATTTNTNATATTTNTMLLTRPLLLILYHHY